MFVIHCQIIVNQGTHKRRRRPRAIALPVLSQVEGRLINPQLVSSVNDVPRFTCAALSK